MKDRHRIKIPTDKTEQETTIPSFNLLSSSKKNTIREKTYIQLRKQYGKWKNRKKEHPNWEMILYLVLSWTFSHKYLAVVHSVV